jgi:hypothetical protein
MMQSYGSSASGASPPPAASPRGVLAGVLLRDRFDQTAPRGLGAGEGEAALERGDRQSFCSSIAFTHWAATAITASSAPSSRSASRLW